MTIHNTSFTIPDQPEVEESSQNEEDLVYQPAIGIWVTAMGEDDIVRLPFSATPGPHEAPHPEAHPQEYVNLFLTEELITHLVTQTNLYAQQFISTHEQHLIDHPHSRVHNWIKDGPTHPQEMRAFLGIITNMGLIQKASIADYWNTANQSIYPLV
jgi:hypothetical protein